MIKWKIVIVFLMSCLPRDERIIHLWYFLISVQTQISQSIYCYSPLFNMIFTIQHERVRSIRGKFNNQRTQVAWGFKKKKNVTECTSTLYLCNALFYFPVFTKYLSPILKFSIYKLWSAFNTFDRVNKKVKNNLIQ